MVFRVSSFASVSTALLLQYGQALGRLARPAAGDVGILAPEVNLVTGHDHLDSLEWLAA
jgi:hypothetical protein